jgi:hypothetical protein
MHIKNTKLYFLGLLAQGRSCFQLYSFSHVLDHLPSKEDESNKIGDILRTTLLRRRL